MGINGKGSVVVYVFVVAIVVGLRVGFFISLYLVYVIECFCLNDVDMDWVIFEIVGWGLLEEMECSKVLLFFFEVMIVFVLVYFVEEKVDL